MSRTTQITCPLKYQTAMKRLLGECLIAERDLTIQVAETSGEGMCYITFRVDKVNLGMLEDAALEIDYKYITMYGIFDMTDEGRRMLKDAVTDYKLSKEAKKKSVKDIVKQCNGQ